MKGCKIEMIWVYSEKDWLNVEWCEEEMMGESRRLEGVYILSGYLDE